MSIQATIAQRKQETKEDLAMSSPFYRCECGCITLKPHHQQGDTTKAIVVWNCDSDHNDDPHSFGERTYRGKDFAPLHDGEKSFKLMREMGRLVSNGQKFDDIQMLLGVPTR